MKTFIMFNNGRWQVCAYRNVNTKKLALKVESLNACFVDWPVQYEDGRIAYDFPERIPAYVRRVVQKILAPSNNQWASLDDIEKWKVV